VWWRCCVTYSCRRFFSSSPSSFLSTLPSPLCVSEFLAAKEVFFSSCAPILLTPPPSPLPQDLLQFVLAGPFPVRIGMTVFPASFDAAFSPWTCRPDAPSLFRQTLPEIYIVLPFWCFVTSFFFPQLSLFLFLPPLEGPSPWHCLSRLSAAGPAALHHLVFTPIFNPPEVSSFLALKPLSFDVGGPNGPLRHFSFLRPVLPVSFP